MYSRHQRAYYYAFLIALVLCWSPSKLIAYFAPWLALITFLFVSRSQRTVRNLILVLGIWLAALPVYALLTPGFVLHSAVLALLTYGAFIFVVVTPTKPLAGLGTSDRMLSLARWVLLFQGTWGIVQGLLSASRSGTFDQAAGDAVAGTIRPFEITPDISNPMFAINISLLLIILLPSLLARRRGWVAFGLGILSLILASVLHVLLFVALAGVVSVIFYYPTLLQRRSGWMATLGFVMAAFITTRLLSGNVATIATFAQYTLEGQTPRAQVVMRTLTRMPTEFPAFLAIGLGPGQFSSRAGLIGTGMYFGSPANPRPLPLLPKGMSEPFRTYVLDLWLSLFFDSSGNYVHTMNNTSSTYVPFFSWLSVFVEQGPIVFVAVAANCLWLLFGLRKRSHTPLEKFTAASVGAGIIFVFLLGFQENYWEVPQAVFIGLLLLKLQYANLVCRPNLPLRNGPGN